MLQYITDNQSQRTAEQQAYDLINAGGRWIELSCEGLTDDRVKEIVSRIMPECISKEAFLLLRDRVDLAKEINAGGVALGQESEFPSHARATLGAAAVIGVEVSSKDQIAALKGLDIDYVMFSDHGRKLDIELVKELCEYMEKEGFEQPRVGAGNVGLDDIEPLMRAGCNGVAMSATLAEASDMTAATKKAIDILKKAEEQLEGI